MSILQTSTQIVVTAYDPYTDPVAYLAQHGIEAELVAEVTPLPEAA